MSRSTYANSLPLPPPPPHPLPPFPSPLPQGWPATGGLEFRGVFMRYRPGLDPVLRGISFTVRGHAVQTLPKGGTTMTSGLRRLHEWTLWHEVPWPLCSNRYIQCQASLVDTTPGTL